MRVILRLFFLLVAALSVRADLLLLVANPSHWQPGDIYLLNTEIGDSLFCGNGESPSLSYDFNHVAFLCSSKVVLTDGARWDTLFTLGDRRSRQTLSWDALGRLYVQQNLSILRIDTMTRLCDTVFTLDSVRSPYRLTDNHFFYEGTVTKDGLKFCTTLNDGYNRNHVLYIDMELDTVVVHIPRTGTCQAAIAFDGSLVSGTESGHAFAWVTRPLRPDTAIAKILPPPSDTLLFCDTAFYCSSPDSSLCDTFTNCYRYPPSVWMNRFSLTHPRFLITQVEAVHHAYLWNLADSQILFALDSVQIWAHAAPGLLPNERSPKKAAAMDLRVANPSGSRFCLSYVSPETEAGIADLFDIRGMQVRRLWSGTLRPGTNRILAPARELPSGPYYVRFKAGRKISWKKTTVFQ